MKYTYSWVLQQLSAHPVFAMCIGSGLDYKHAEAVGMDFMILNSNSRYRQMGLNSLAASLPFNNSNKMTLEYAEEEILPNHAKIPLVFGVYANDPTTDLDQLLTTLEEHRISGVCNLPTINVVDGDLRKELEYCGFGFAKEVQAISAAHQRGFFTIGFVADEQQTEQMLNAGCDAICAFLGVAKGGLLGAQNEQSLSSAMALANRIFHTVDCLCPSVLKLVYGGPCKSPSAVEYLMERTSVQGFVGGYMYERILVEQPLTGKPIRDFFLDRAQTPPPSPTTNYIAFIQNDISENYSEPLSLNSYAEELHVTVSYLSALFKKTVGENFSTYLTMHRLHKATEFLDNTSFTIEQVGIMVGYRDYAHFVKTFKKHIGMTPAQYKKKHPQRPQV